MAGNDNQQSQHQQRVRHNFDGPSGQAGLQALIPSPSPSAASDRHDQSLTTQSGDASAQGHTQNQPSLATLQGPAPRPVPPKDSPNSLLDAQTVSDGQYPSAAELQDLGRRWFAYECAKASYQENPRQWRVAPSDADYFGPDQRRWLRQMANTADPSPAQLQRNTLLHNTFFQLKRSMQPQTSYPGRPPAASAQAAHIPQAHQGAPRAPQPAPAPQAYQIPQMPQAPRPSNLELIWDAPSSNAARPASMPPSGAVAGTPVFIYPEPTQYQNLSNNPHAVINHANVVRHGHPGTQTPLQRQAHAQTTTPSAMTLPAQHSVNGGIYRAIQPAPPVNRSAPQPPFIHQPIPRPIPNASSMLHAAVGPLYPPRHAEFWSETGSLLRPGGDPRFMDLSWMASGRRPRPSEESTATRVTAVTRPVSQSLPAGEYRATSPSSAQSEMPAVAAGLRRSASERRAVDNEESDRSPPAKKVRMGSSSADDMGARKKLDKDGL